MFTNDLVESVITGEQLRLFVDKLLSLKGLPDGGGGLGQGVGEGYVEG